VFTVNLVSASGATIFDGQGVGTILNDDGSVLRIDDVKKAEGNSGIIPFIFTVTLSPAAASTVTVNCATANGTATAPSDYTAVNTLLTFLPGQTSKTCTVPVIGNTILEPNEFFTANLTTVVGPATVFDGQGVGTILNDDGPLLRIGDVIATEGNAGSKNFIVTVTLSPAAASNVTVNCVSANGSATAPSDYTTVNLPLTFAPGQTSKTCTVPVVGNTVVEPNETFFVNLSGASGATIFDGQGVGTILNDDGPVLRITDVSRAEGNSGTTLFTFTLTLSPAAASNVTVTYATANGTATAPSDYTTIPPTPLVFSPGETSRLVTVFVKGDTVVEPNETFTVNLINAVGATIGDPDFRGLGTIVNDD
jgi:chitinase